MGKLRASCRAPLEQRTVDASLPEGKLPLREKSSLYSSPKIPLRLTCVTQDLVARP
jgi:hypothetical protein